jgi:hypothetical protein
MISSPESAMLVHEAQEAMKLGTAQRRRFAAWLGILALGLQGLIPLFVAAEISLAARVDEGDAFRLCLYGVDRAATPDKQGKHGGERHDLGFGACPLCLALQAGPAFTAPESISLPPPTTQVLGVLPAAPDAVAPRLARAAYRSRAPPIG